MKIEETCFGTEQPIEFSKIPLGTVFRYSSNGAAGSLGPSLFLKVLTGLVSLSQNVFYAQGPEIKYYNYTPFPAARVVLK